LRDRPGRASDEAVGKGIVGRVYDPYDLPSVRAALDGCGAVINLAGENVLGERWRTPFLENVRRSRIETTRVLVDACVAMEAPPRVLLSASAVGIYGARQPEDTCTEATTNLGSDFLAVLCRDWEAAAKHAERADMRVVLLRTGVVLGRGGGALGKMEGPFRWGLGGRIGRGHHVMSWIHVRDMERLVLFCLERDDVRGPVNATAPHPVSNREFTRALAHALARPALVPVPAFALKAMFGRGASVLTTGQRVLPEVLLRAGFEFEHETLEAALADLYATP